MADQPGNPDGPEKKSRGGGAQNELEVLGEIVQSNPALKRAVLERLREAKNRWAASKSSAAKSKD